MSVFRNAVPFVTGADHYPGAPLEPPGRLIVAPAGGSQGRKLGGAGENLHTPRERGTALFVGCGMPADRSPIRESALGGRVPCAYAMPEIPDAADLGEAAAEARRLGFEAMLVLASSARAPAAEACADATLNAFARAAHNQGLLAWLAISLHEIDTSHTLVASAPRGTFGAAAVQPGLIADPRQMVVREPGSVRLRRPACAMVETWWLRRLAALGDLGIDGFVSIDPTSAGVELARNMTAHGHRIDIFRTAAWESAEAAAPVFIGTGCATTDPAAVDAVLAHAALYAESWAISQDIVTARPATISWLNGITRTGTVRTWSGPGAPLDIRSRGLGEDALVVIRNARATPQAWPPQPLPALPWQEISPAPGFPALEDNVAPGETLLLQARPCSPIAVTNRPDAQNAAVASRRVVISSVSPSVDRGEYPVKIVVGESMLVRADIFADGHEQLAANVLVRAIDEANWTSHAMLPDANDVWHADISFARLGRHEICVAAWLDVWGGFTRDLERKRQAGQDLALEILEGQALIAAAIPHGGTDEPALAATLTAIQGAEPDQAVEQLLAPGLSTVMRAASERKFLTRSYVQPVDVEREAARFSSWYELFPRSQAPDGKGHGTFTHVIAKLPHIARMGFDVLYFPPIHPIGTKNRKGRNNALTASPGDVGSPYAIGSSDGGHDAIHPDLGSLADFHNLLARAREIGMEVALDFAIQCAPDHPWLIAHPGWFAWRPDGSIKYAENPPKKYQDIVNVDFYAPGSVPDLWHALRDVVLYWVAQGVRIFRVDNPHTKPLPFWQWMIADVKAQHPDVIFLAEAFTRPKPMYHLAKVGFSQSYTYFTWRNTKQELTSYMTELTQSDVRDFFRPHFFVNTPDINPVFLQTSGRPGFLIRAALATTLSGLWGMYAGFELCEAAPLPGREEYLNSEKYELRPRPHRAAGDIVDEITHLNRLRRAEPALQTHLGLSFHNAFNDNILYYSKYVPGYEDRLLIAVNLDPHSTQEADFEVPLWLFGLSDSDSVDVQDLLDGRSSNWSGKIQRMRLTPDRPYAIWRIQPLRGDAAHV